ncbi:MAG: hypothetical protein WCS37_21620 [Chloroflexota bacterium]
MPRDAIQLSAKEFAGLVQDYASSKVGQKQAQAMAATYKTVGTTPTFQQGHGPGGTFSATGQDPLIVNAAIAPINGVEALLPEFPTQFTLPQYSIITGQTASSGSEPTEDCDDWTVAGSTELCKQIAVFSRQGKSSRVIDLTTIGQLRDPADFTGYTLAGDVLAGKSPNVPQGMKSAVGGPNEFLTNEYAKAMHEVLFASKRDFARDVWIGNPANNPNGHKGRQYYKGFDLLIKTGHTDFVTQDACAAADSVIKSFNNALLNTNGPAIVLAVVNIWREIQTRAVDTAMDLGDRDLVLAMPRELFYTLTAYWPCAYFTNACVTASGSSGFVDVTDQIKMRDEMRTGKFLWIDGVQVPVVADTSIVRTSIGGGTFSSQIYFIPLKAANNKVVTYKHYFNFDGPNAAGDTLGKLGTFGQAFFTVTDAGKYIWTYSYNNSCFKLQATSKQALVLRTPYLSGRLTNIRYQPLAIEKSWDTTDPYYVGGGDTQQYYFPPA